MSLTARAVAAALISGTLRGKKVRDGSVDVDVATCGGHDTWTARRASR